MRNILDSERAIKLCDGAIGAKPYLALHRHQGPVGTGAMDYIHGEFVIPPPICSRLPVLRFLVTETVASLLLEEYVIITKNIHLVNVAYSDEDKWRMYQKLLCMFLDILDEKLTFLCYWCQYHLHWETFTREWLAAPSNILARMAYKKVTRCWVLGWSGKDDYRCVIRNVKIKKERLKV